MWLLCPFYLEVPLSMAIIAKILSVPKKFPYVHPCQRKCALCGRFGCYAHGYYPRYPPGGSVAGAGEMVMVSRFLCLSCRRTFSQLPFFLVRRIAIPLPILLYIAESKRTWDFLLEIFDISRNTLWAWKRLGLKLLEKIPLLFELPTLTWATLSLHISRLQYPNNLRKPHPTIP